MLESVFRDGLAVIDLSGIVVQNLRVDGTEVIEENIIVLSLKLSGCRGYRNSVSNLFHLLKQNSTFLILLSVHGPAELLF